MDWYEVDVHLGGGGDTDGIATYLVYAVSEGDAEDTGLREGRRLINAKANRTSIEPVDEMDYDGVIVSKLAWSVPFDEGGPGTNDGPHLLEQQKEELDHTV